MIFLYGQWLKLPLTTRAQIAQTFGIIKRGSTEVFDNRVVNDGYVITEIEGALNIDALQKYLAAEDTDMVILWDKLVAKAEGREYQPPITVAQVVQVLDAMKKEKKERKVYCDLCQSKSPAFHKKLCPKRKTA